MNIKKSMLVTGAASVVALASIASVSAATTSTTGNGQDNLISKIATKFNLKQSDVKAVFDQAQADRQAEREKQVAATLDQLVKDGKITSAQKDLIVTKQAELQTQMQANRSAMTSQTMAERKAAMDAKKAELDKWASDNGISTDVLQQVMGGGRGMGGHFGPGGPHGDADDAASTSNSTQSSTSN